MNKCKVCKKKLREAIIYSDESGALPYYADGFYKRIYYCQNDECPVKNKIVEH
jgi:hypothetical protein